MLIALDLVVLMLAAATTIRGLRGRWIGDEPRCRRCGYSLRGRIEGMNRCPECGADLLDAGAITIGVRWRRHGWITLWTIVLVLSLALPARELFVEMTEFSWLTWEPTSWVLADARSPKASLAALKELHRRVLAGRIRNSQIAPVVTAAMAVESAAVANGPKGSDWFWADMIEAFQVAGRLSAQDWDRYLDLAIRPVLTLRHRVNVGAPAVMEIGLNSIHVARMKVIGSWKLRSVSVNGQTIHSPEISGDFNFNNGAFSSGSGIGSDREDRDEPMTPGVKHLTATVDLDETITPAAIAGTQSKPISTEQRHVQITLKDNLNVAAPARIDEQSIAASRAAMIAGLAATVGRAADNSTRLTITATGLPYPINAQLKLIGRGGWTAPVKNWFYSAKAHEKNKLSIRLRADWPTPVEIDLVPDPTNDVASHRIEDVVPWPETLHFKVTGSSQAKGGSP